MKKQFLLLVAISICSSLMAQKVDLDRYHFRGFQYYILPTAPLADDFKTYNVKITSPGSIRNSFPDDQVESKIKINGWKVVSKDEKAHITIKVNLSPLVITKSEVSERKEEIKDKDGKVTGTKYYYRAIFVYNIEGSNVSCEDYKGVKVNLNPSFSRSSSFSSDEFGTYAAARDYLSNNRDNLRDKFINDLVSGICYATTNAATSAWGLTEHSSSDHFWLMDSKKHAEQDSMQLMAKFMKEEFSKMTYAETNEAFQSRITPFINYLKNLPNKYKSDEKNDKKLRYSAYYNLAKVAYYLDNPTDMKKYAGLLEKNDYDPKDAKDIIKDAESLEASFKKARINTRHLSFDSNSFEQPK